MEKAWFKWYPASYRAATMHLSAEQDGIYRRLIDHYMETRKPLPNNHAALARVAGIGFDSFSMAFAILEPFFCQGDDGNLHIAKCDDVLHEQDAISKKRRKSGKAGAQQRWDNKQENRNCHNDARPEPEQNDGREEEKREEEKREEYKNDDLGARAFEITDWCQRRLNAPWPYIAAPVYAWLEWGVDLEKDVKPVVEKYITTKGDPPRSLAFLNDRIAASIRQRKTPMPVGGNYNAKPTSRHTGFADIDYHGSAENSGFDTN